MKPAGYRRIDFRYVQYTRSIKSQLSHANSFDLFEKLEQELLMLFIRRQIAKATNWCLPYTRTGQSGSTEFLFWFFFKRLLTTCLSELQS